MLLIASWVRMLEEEEGIHVVWAHRIQQGGCWVNDFTPLWGSGRGVGRFPQHA